MKRKNTPQSWKPKELEMEDFVDGLRDDETTTEYFIPDPELFMEDWEDDDITQVRGT